VFNPTRQNHAGWKLSGREIKFAAGEPRFARCIRPQTAAGSELAPVAACRAALACTTDYPAKGVF